MGSHSWSIAGSGHRVIRMFTSKVLLVIVLLVSSVLSLLEVKTRSAVRYLGDTFLLPDGCPVEDPLVQRFYQLCLETRGGDTLCGTDRIPNGRSLTIPALSNVCRYKSFLYIIIMFDHLMSDIS